MNSSSSARSARSVTLAHGSEPHRSHAPIVAAPHIERRPDRSLAVRARTVSLVVPIRSTHAVPIRKHARRPGPHRIAYKSRSAQYRTPSRFVGTLDVPIRAVRRPAPRCHIPLV